MPVTDLIIRRGSAGKEVKLGCDKLWGPSADHRHRVGADIHRITGDVDLYAASSSACAPGPGTTPPGTYTFTINSFVEHGFKRYIKAIRAVAVVNIKENDKGDVEKCELLFKKSVPATDRKFVIGPFQAKPLDNLYLVIERLGGVSSIQYQLELDCSILKESEIETPRVRRERKVKPPTPMREVEEETPEDKAWKMVSKD